MCKKQMLCMGMAVIFLVLSGCQENPESSIVTNKDFDKMVSQAEDEESGIKKVEEVAEAYNSYQNSFSDDSLGVTVHVNAKVDIPKSDTMSVFRVGRKEITQEFLDKARQALMPGVELYEGAALLLPTKSSIEENIQFYKDNMKSVEEQAKEGIYDERTVEIYREEYQSAIDRLQEQYESAPKEIPLEDYKSDGQLHLVKDLTEGDLYFDRKGDFDQDGSFFDGISDGGDGVHRELYVQNNKDYGNCLRYTKCSSIGIFDTSSLAVISPLEQDGTAGEPWKASEEPNSSMTIPPIEEYRESAGEPLTISEEEAEGQAQALMDELGLKEYQCYDSDIYCQEIINDNGILEYRKVYIFRYYRNIDGAFVKNQGIGKFAEEWSGEEYSKQEWHGESVLVYVNDNGIVGFYYLNPLEVTETVVDKASMKPFTEIRDIFEQMIVVTGAREGEKVDIQIDRVTLNYMRISEADSFDTGLLVPVWSFEGTYTTELGTRNRKGSLLTVNAIDGSVISQTLGY